MSGKDSAALIRRYFFAKFTSLKSGIVENMFLMRLGLRILILTGIGFILAVLGLFISVVSYFLQQNLILGVALCIIGIIIFAIGSSIHPKERH